MDTCLSGFVPLTNVALLLAPFFVFMEVLFALGYRPKLQESLEKETLKSISEWKAMKAKSGKKHKA
jgi:uncharacterized membrane protein YGL010W